MGYLDFENSVHVVQVVFEFQDGNIEIENHMNIRNYELRGLME